MKPLIIAVLLGLCPLTAAAQSGRPGVGESISFGADAPFRLDWAAAPKPYKIADSLRKYSAAVLLDRRQLHYKQDGTDIVVYHTVHRIIKVLDQKGIESFNTFTLEVSEGKSMDRLKARTILPNGKVIKVDQDKIKTSKSESGAPQYYVALEGVEKDAEIEYFFTEKRPLNVFGMENIQWSIPVIKTEISFIMPERMKFEFRGYNGYPQPTDDSLLNGQRVYHVAYGPVSPLEEEKYSNYGASLMRLDYKLSYLTENEKTRMFTWDDLARQLYESYYTYTGREEKTVSRYLKSIGVDDITDELQKVRTIEEALKSSIVISGDIADDEYAKFDVILARKLTTEQGFTRFFTACLQGAGVRNQLGLTSTYADHPLDEQFENWSALDHYLIYLPGQKGFIDPANLYTRYPVVPASVLYNKGVFCRISGTGSKASTSAMIRTINALPIEETGNSIDADITFDEDGLTPKIHFRHMFSGYASLGLRSLFAAVPADKMKELVTQFISVAEKPDDISTYKVENKAMKDYATNLPLVVDATATAPHLMEKAGPKYLFKLGDVIGRQNEMYSDKKRRLPIQIEYPHTFIRHLNITIPEGFVVKNPEAVRFNVVLEGSAKEGEGIGFVSDYKMDGNKMLVTIREYYNQVQYPVSAYDTFRKVINAAADFNKVVLVLEKKK